MLKLTKQNAHLTKQDAHLKLTKQDAHLETISLSIFRFD